ncbi:MAG TPA: hypothetical protein VHV55_27735 [Pirellulales bacterium]|jgi:hypothetical protein|nr:hypothetical protein [Pirellulales bacterium]
MTKSKLIFYRQQRVDGGVRTGVDWHDYSLLQHFERGDDDDSSLLWYVDLRFKGPRLPKDPEEVRDWLIEQQAWLAKSLSNAAKDLEVGVDADVLPYIRICKEAPPGIVLELAVSAQKRASALQIGKAVSQIGKQWARLIGSLEPLAVE